MTFRGIYGRERVRKTIGVVLATGAMALATPGNAAAVPDDGSVPTNPAVRDYLRTINGVIEQVNSEALSGPVDSDIVTQQIASATDRLREALLGADPTS